MVLCEDPGGLLFSRDVRARLPRYVFIGGAPSAPAAAGGRVGNGALGSRGAWTLPPPGLGLLRHRPPRPAGTFSLGPPSSERLIPTGLVTQRLLTSRIHPRTGFNPPVWALPRVRGGGLWLAWPQPSSAH